VKLFKDKKIARLPGIYNGRARSSILCTLHQIYLGLGGLLDTCAQSYRNIFRDHIDGVLLGEVRQPVNQGLALGSEQFK